VGVPVTAPVDQLTERPEAKPAASHVKLAPASVPVAELAMEAIGDPETSDCALGLVTVTVLVTGLVAVQAKPAEPLAPVPSVAVTLTE
jgi:hypothetical protein